MKVSSSSKTFALPLLPLLGASLGLSAVSAANVDDRRTVADSSGGDNQGGFVSDGSPLYGISQLHDDGTGGSSSSGNFALLPQYCSFSTGKKSSCATRQDERAVGRVDASAKGEPGWFAIDLASGIKTQVTVTDHVALHRFDYTGAMSSNRKRMSKKRAAHSAPLEPFTSAPNASHSKAGPTLLFDLTNDLPYTYQGSGSLSISTSSTNGSSTARMVGGGEFLPSFGTGSHKVYFCADVPGVESFGIYTNHILARGLDHIVNPPNETGALLKLDEAYLRSNNNTLPVRIGISWTSADKACTYAEGEIPEYESANDFENVKSGARDAWNGVLSTIQPSTQGVSKKMLTNFWSSLYRTYIAPTNITGDNPLWTSTEPYYDSLYCIWHSMRDVHPLYALLNPVAQAEVVRAAIDIWRHEGFLPDCRMSLNKGFTQGGSNADNLLADSYVKGIRSGINWSDGLQAMLKDATVSPADWGVEGRGGIAARKRLGYVPQDGGGNKPSGKNVVEGRTASRTLEYAFNDFGIALVAKGLGQSDVYSEYVNKSGDWKNLWNPDLVSEGYKGFIQPRLTNGSFAFQDPRKCSPAYQFGTCYLFPDSGEFYEASAWQYSFYAPHDMATLVKLMGGDKRYLDRLDYLWDHHYGDVGDEVGFLPTYQYSYAKGGYPRTVDRVLDILRNNFNTSRNGVPGNDDSGAMGAYVVWSTLGFLPVAGTSVYLLSTPLFPSYTITNGQTGKIAHVTTVNFDGAVKNKYIVSAKLDGQVYTKNWIEHSIFTRGSSLQLTLGPEPGGFGTASGDLPPSLSTGGFGQFAAEGY